jgi:hypothetical protein
MSFTQPSGVKAMPANVAVPCDGVVKTLLVESNADTH